MNFLLDPAIAIYVALAAALIVWLGVFAFLWRIDQHAQELKRKLDQAPPADQLTAPRAIIETRQQKSRAATSE